MLKHLTVAEMAALGLAWVNKGTRRDTFLSIAEIAPLHPQVVEAHQAILAVQPADKTMSPDLRVLLQKGEVIDARHDHLVRASSLALELTRELCLAADPPDVDRAAVCDRVHGKLLPDGLAVINTSWLAEAGSAARLEKLLEEESDLRPFLKTISVPGKGTLLDVVGRWITAGHELSKVEHLREEMLQKQAAPADRATIQAARSRWTRLVSAILSNLELSSAKAEAIESIRGPVSRASDRAGKRYASGTPDAEVLDPEDQGASGEEPAPK
jgi:hypothetical protein